MKARPTSILVLLVVGAVLLLPTRPPLARGEGKDAADELQKLAERVTALEKEVISDPYKPKSTVLARLDAIEERLKGLDKQDEKEQRTDTRTFDDMKKQLEQSQKTIAQLERR